MNVPRAVVFAVGIVSGAALAYEILLIRLFAIVEWHHLAFLVISMALLGYAASGTAITIARERLLRRFAPITSTSAAAFGLTSVASFVAFQRMEFNSLEIIWSGREIGKLAVVYLFFAAPFFFAATAVGLTLTRFGSHSPRIYRADLIGAGASAGLITALLFAVHPVTALQVTALTAVAAALLFLAAGEPRSRVAVLLLALVAAIIACSRPLLLPVRISQFKELSHALRIPSARIIEERSSPLALLTVVDSPAVPFRFAPGLSLAYAGEVPPQVGIFSDGSGMSAITRYEGPSSAAHLDFVPSAAAYHLRGRFADVAIVGAGGGSEVLSALTHGAQHVTAVELNPQMIDLVAHRFGGYGGDIYRDRRVTVVNAEARRFITESRERFDLIQIALVDSFGASTAGAYALSESPLYTVEAIGEMLAHLRDGGYLVITRWTQVPPRDVVKLFATAAAALERAGARPQRSLALLRTWNTASVIVKRGMLDAGELTALRRFADERWFDLDYAPGVQKGETNRYNILDEPALYEVATALVAGERAREDFFDRYKFFVRPATDDRPYFFHFFKWRALPELLRLRGRSGVPLVEWGYVILIVAIAQAVVAGFMFVALPIVLMRARGRPETSLVRVAIYFGSIGLAFLFLEIALIQRLTLFLGHPLYAVAVVLSAVLVFAGIGSGFLERVRARWGERAVYVARFAVAAVALIELPVTAMLVEESSIVVPVAKVLASVAIVAPLALLMGMPFPGGLQQIARVDPASVPWAWAINGTASVVSPMLATLLAVHFGFSAVVIAAALLYAIAAFAAHDAQSLDDTSSVS